MLIFLDMHSLILFLACAKENSELMDSIRNACNIYQQISHMVSKTAHCFLDCLPVPKQGVFFFLLVHTVQLASLKKKLASLALSVLHLGRRRSPKPRVHFESFRRENFKSRGCQRHGAFSVLFPVL